MNGDIDEQAKEKQRRHLSTLAENVILDWVNTAYAVMLATLPKSDVAGRKAVDQMRHLHLAEPWIPANKIASKADSSFCPCGLVERPNNCGWCEE